MNKDQERSLSEHKSRVANLESQLGEVCSLSTCSYIAICQYHTVARLYRVQKFRISSNNSTCNSVSINVQ